MKFLELLATGFERVVHDWAMPLYDMWA